MDLFVDRMMSPIGTITLVWEGVVLRSLNFSDNEQEIERFLRIHYDNYRLTPGRAPMEIRTPLEAYFEGDLMAIDRIKVQTHGTPFQQQVWAALRKIPAGKTKSYGDLARQIGRPNACRAVGLANGSNPVGIVVPCHRVIGANGSLTGYGGGIDRKRWLLAHEQGGALPF
jgi:methylated-DNA-[protein]-cysteine S-methyltransferase